MQKTLTLYDTTLGKKAVVALTGAVLYGFVIVHMVGNLQIFLGPEAVNQYAASLRATPALVWSTRVVLLASLVVHVALTLSLVATSAQARPVGYRIKKNTQTTYAAITMRYGGPALALFIVFHLAHLTFPGLAFGSYEHSHTDVYANLVQGFRIPWVVGTYVAANVFLGLHLQHGAWSMLQTLGLSHPRYDGLLKLGPPALGLAVAGGNILMPLCVLAGVVR